MTLHPEPDFYLQVIDYMSISPRVNNAVVDVKDEGAISEGQLLEQLILKVTRRMMSTVLSHKGWCSTIEIVNSKFCGNLQLLMNLDRF